MVAYPSPLHGIHEVMASPSPLLHPQAIISIPTPTLWHLEDLLDLGHQPLG